MKKGDIVLIPFPFTDLSGAKARPALVLVVDTFDITVAFITSKVIKQELNDVAIFPEPSNGLKVESFIKLNKLATLKKELILGELGKASTAEITNIDRNLIVVFDIKL